MPGPSSWRSPSRLLHCCPCHKIFCHKHGRFALVLLSFLIGFFLCPILTTKRPPTSFRHLLPNFSRSIIGTYSGGSDFKSVGDRIPVVTKNTFGIDSDSQRCLSEASDSQVIFDLARNTKMKPDDPLLLRVLRKYYLLPPLPLHYHLKYPKGDPAKVQGQPEEVLRLLKNMTNGVFVEAGANNGEFLSTTLRLERDYGWTGLLVEPDSRAFSVLKAKGRRSWLTNSCLSVTGKPEKVTFIKNLKTVLSKVENVGNHHKRWKNATKETVPCFPFYSLVSALNMTVIDYFSLDVEGAELAVLKTIPFDKVLIRTMSVEFNHINRVRGQDRQLRTLMKSKGYVLVKKLTGPKVADYIFAHSTTLHGSVRPLPSYL